MQEEILDENLLEEEDIKVPMAPYPTIRARAVALFLDAWFLGMVLLFAFFVGTYFNWPPIFLLPFFLLPPLYKWWMEAQFGATVGKKMLQIKVVYFEYQSPISWFTSFKRNVVIFPFFLAFVGIVFLDSQKVGRSGAFGFEFFRWVFYLGMLYSIGYLLSLLTLFIKHPPRTVFDRIAKTVCINVAREEDE
ncbi:MAG: RDD family protein [Aureispira sp.]